MQISLFTNWLDPVWLYVTRWSFLQSVSTQFLNKVSACWKYDSKQKKVIFNRSQWIYKKPMAVLQFWSQHTPPASTRSCSSVEGIAGWTAESTKHCGKYESVGSDGSRFISSSSLWVSWPAWGTGCRSRFPRWLLPRERRHWEEAWSSLCPFLDHPEWGKEKKRWVSAVTVVHYTIHTQHISRNVVTFYKICLATFKTIS